MRREWRRFGPGIALGAAVLVVGGTAVLVATAGTAGPADTGGDHAAAPAWADLAGPLAGPCLLGIIGDCAPPPTPTPTYTFPSSTASTPAPTDSGTTAPSHQPTTAPPRSRHPHSPPAHHRERVRTTVPAGLPSTHHGSGKSSLPVAATTSVDPTPAGTTLSASEGVPATPDQGERQESASMLRPLMQLFPVVAICLAIAVVVVVSAARRGSRRTRGANGRRRHRHTYSDADEYSAADEYSDAEELVHPYVAGPDSR